MAALLSDLHALKQGLDDGLLSEAEYAVKLEKLMAVKRSDGGGGAGSDMLLAVNALTDVAKALSHGVRSCDRTEGRGVSHPSLSAYEGSTSQAFSLSAISHSDIYIEHKFRHKCEPVASTVGRSAAIASASRDHRGPRYRSRCRRPPKKQESQDSFVAFPVFRVLLWMQESWL